MTTEKKARTFWLEKCEDYEGCEYLVPWTFRPPFEPPKGEDDAHFDKDKFIHVIEKSAFDELAAENEKLKAKLAVVEIALQETRSQMKRSQLNESKVFGGCYQLIDEALARLKGGGE